MSNVWKKNPATGEPTFEEYMKKLNGHWTYDSTRGTDPEVTADAEDFSACWGNDDAVNSPSHYKTGSIECIDALNECMNFEQFRGYLRGNCLKYLWRYEYKGKPLEDLQKSQWYLNKLIKLYEK